MAQPTGGYHRPVLLEQTLQALHIRPDGIYLDGTAGGGGHSHAIAERLTTGRLIALDQDPDAIAAAGARLQGLPATVVQANFVQMGEVLDGLEIPAVDGILLDIGVSSHQLDAPERGFSYHYDAPLDMRMSQSGETAAGLLARLSERELAEIFYRYGEEKFSRPIARAIVRQRDRQPIETTLQLVDVIKAAMPPQALREKQHPAKRSFQAIRIAVNGELDALPPMLNAAAEHLNTGGRLAVISFHSLEDRIIKKTMQELATGCTCPPNFPVCVCGKKPKMKLISRKPITPGEAELAENPRARSAKLRVAEKL